MKTRHLRLTSKKLLYSSIFLVGLLIVWPMHSEASTISYSDAHFLNATTLNGSTLPFAKVFLFKGNEKPVKFVKAGENGHFILSHTYEHNKDYLVIIKKGSHLHYFTVTFDEALQSGGGFLSGENDW